MTQTVSIRDLTHATGRFVRAAADGQRLIITDRGTPVADLVPHTEQTAATRYMRPFAPRHSGGTLDNPNTQALLDELDGTIRP
ncbi:MAG: type II toxin-antitoxin system prevent-host-death family antitoxin [Micrococcales bacterium]|nr:type II toxin-antitoxin system prevent-host-death family antitoxin [Micrococcales bacterium]